MFIIYLKIINRIQQSYIAPLSFFAIAMTEHCTAILTQWVKIVKEPKLIAEVCKVFNNC